MASFQLGAIGKGTTPPANTKLYKVADEATNFRDMSEMSRKGELATKVGLGVAAALVAIGIAVAIYFCVTTNETYFCWNHMAMHTVSNAPLAALPGVFGTFILAGLIVGAIMVDFESCRNGHKPYRPQTGEQASTTHILTQGDLNKIYDTYYKKNGGLTHLVREGYITVGQANNLREMFKEVEKQKKAQAKFGTHAEGFNNKKFEQLQQQWQGIQRELQTQYRYSAEEGVES